MAKEAPAAPSTQRSIEFVVALGRALHQRGVPAHRLEQALQEVAQALGLEAQFYATPTALLSSFATEDAPLLHLDRLAVGAVSLGTMARLDALAQRVVHRDVTIPEALRELDEITARPVSAPGWLTTCGFALASAAAARLFGGGSHEIGAALACGALVGGLAGLVRQRERMMRLFEPLGAFLVGLGATLLAGWISLDLATTTVSGLIVLVPGLTLTIAVTELALGSLVSGSSRSFSALLSFLMLGFGAILGSRVGLSLIETLPAATTDLPSWTAWLAVLAAALSFAVLLDAEPRDVPWILLIATASWATAAWLARWVEPPVAALGAAVVAGATSNLHARFLHRPVMVTRVTALLLLVPGSIGFRGVSSFLDRDILSAVDAVFNVALIAVALVLGLLVANALVAPRRRL